MTDIVPQSTQTVRLEQRSPLRYHGVSWLGSYNMIVAGTRSTSVCGDKISTVLHLQVPISLFLAAVEKSAWGISLLHDGSA